MLHTLTSNALLKAVAEPEHGSGSENPSSLRFAIAMAAALGGPVFYGIVNLVDKVAISRRVRHTSSYLAIVGIFDAVFGSMIGFAGTWRGPEVSGLGVLQWMWPVLGGVSLGSATYFYYFALEGADVSKVVGIEYIYPLFVTLLSYFFLHDPITIIGYVGIAVTTSGAMMLSLNFTKVILRLFLKLRCFSKQRTAFEERNRKLKEKKLKEEEEDEAEEDDDSPPDGPDLFYCFKACYARLCGGGNYAKLHGGDEEEATPPTASINADRADMKVVVVTPPTTRPFAAIDHDLDGAERQHLAHGTITELGEPLPDSDTNGFPTAAAAAAAAAAAFMSAPVIPKAKRARAKSERFGKAEESTALLRTKSVRFDRKLYQDGYVRPRKFMLRKSYARLPLIQPGGKKKGDEKKGGKRNLVMLLLIPLVILISLNEFFTKIATNYLPENNVAAINSASFGLTLAAVIILPSTRKHFLWEFRYNWMWAFLSEMLTLASAYCIVIAMASLSAPIVSSLAAVQPFYILVLERITRIAPDTCGECMLYKLIPISVIIAGVCMLSFSVIG